METSLPRAYLCRSAALATLLVTQAWGSPALAADPDYKVVQRIDLTRTLGTKTPWRAVVYESIAVEQAIASGPVGGDQQGVLNRPARICFVGGAAQSNDCLDTNTTDAAAGRTEDTEQLVWQKLTPVFLAPGADGFRGVMLRTVAYADSGMEVGTRIWRYDPATDSLRLVGIFSGSDVSEVEPLHNSAGESLLIATDEVWANDEGHRSPHHFRIRVLRYGLQGRFEPALDYVTEAKYAVLDGAEIVAHVIKGEFGTICAKMRATRPEWGHGAKRMEFWP